MPNTEQIEQSELAKLGRQVAHDLNNPIGAIVTSIYLIDDFLTTAEDGRIAASELKPFVESIREECDSLKELVEQFAKYSTLDSLLPMPLELREFVMKRAEDMARTGMPVTFEDNGEAILIEADAPNLEFVIRTLAQFAKASGASRIVFSAQNSGSPRIIICDDRPKKIDTADVGQMFEVGPVRNGVRMGLKLPLARKIVELHGGEIRLDPANEAMTQFDIVLPAP